MGQSEFDFDSFLEARNKRQEEEISALRSGLKYYEDQLDVLETQRCELEEEIELISKKVDKIRSILGTTQDEQQKETPRRDRGVLPLLRQMVLNWRNEGICEKQTLDDVVKHVRKIKPDAKESTVRSGLRRLVDTGELEVEGKRGSMTWKLSTEAPVEGPPDESQKSNGELKEELSHNEIVKKTAKRIMESIEKNKDGIGAKTVALIMTELGIDELHFEAAVKHLEMIRMVEVAKSLKDGSQVIRVPAEPDSKEELKRIRVQGKSLFPNMDEPSHA